jgi:hypothetical protein
LPDYGFISCKNVYTEDTFIDTDYDTTVDLEEIKYDEYNYERLKKNSNRLTDLTTVYNTINEGRPLLVSIYEEDEGETILLVYGYTKEGNLLLCNPTTEDEDILYIYPHSRRAINKEGQVIQYEYFEYDGCGFDSTNQKTTISFFSNIDVVEN